MIFSSRILHQKETKSRNFQTKEKKTANFSLNMFGNTKKKSKFAPSIDCKIV